MTAGFPFKSSLAATDTDWRMPDEAEPHTSTWMAFGANKSIWGEKQTFKQDALVAGFVAKQAKFELI